MLIITLHVIAPEMTQESPGNGKAPTDFEKKTGGSDDATFGQRPHFFHVYSNRLPLRRLSKKSRKITKGASSCQICLRPRSISSRDWRHFRWLSLRRHHPMAAISLTRGMGTEVTRICVPRRRLQHLRGGNCSIHPTG